MSYDIDSPFIACPSTTSSTCGSSSIKSNNLSAQAKVWSNVFERLLKATTGPKDEAIITIATSIQVNEILPIEYCTNPTPTKVNIAIIIVKSVIALIIPSCSLILSRLLFILCDFELISFNLSSPDLNNNTSLSPLKESSI